MNPLSLLCNAVDALRLESSPSAPILRGGKPKSGSLHFWFSPSINFSNRVSLCLPSKSQLGCFSSRSCQTMACSAAEIDMVKNKEGIYAPKQKKVAVLWDLDNKPPRGPPYQAAVALRRAAQRFGDIVDMSAYANRHAFIHLPERVLRERRERKQMDILERKGIVIPSETYVCGVCGRKYKTNFDLKKHFKQLHERERQKKLSRMRSLKGKKRQRYKERRAGVFVKTVEDKPQAADWALKRQMQHSMNRGMDWLFLVSDDSDFSEMLRRAKEANLGTVVVGDFDRALGRHEDLWISWIGVENGELSEKDLVPKNRRRRDSFAKDDGLFSISHYDGDIDGHSDLDGIVEELVAMRTVFNDVTDAAFSDVDGDEEGWVSGELNEDYMFVNSEDEDTEEEEEGFY
ncbi:hypothetical protein L6164_024637 [Bauhinia variegata]|uniref:Uncharacterized protein n=1 Tax=Bauhinia variegata TaxID=167791 RepID=A0ACB9M0L8_BAUVA|nr:hypothetical protein L6164_024637 [Bauhinia variegata]